jgi:beta-glucanase (GH16 family)
MLPVDNNKYGTGWPINGEIDIMEARGNAPSYPNGGNNVIRSTLNYGPLKTLVKSIFGWQEFKRTSLANGFHTYTMEWTHDFMRFYIDSRLHSMLLLDTKKKDFFSKGGFPATFQNGTDAQVVIENPWGADKKDGDGNKLTKTPTNAPFDQEFYLIINLAVGGTSGWFPDEVAEKPWYDKAESAMVDFAAAHEKWVPTWGKKESGERDFIMWVFFFFLFLLFVWEDMFADVLCFFSKSVKMEQSTRDGTC